MSVTETLHNKNLSCYKCRQCAGHYVHFVVHSLEYVYPYLRALPNSSGVHKTLLPIFGNGQFPQLQAQKDPLGFENY